MKNSIYSEIIVKKPWGQEYLCFANEIVAIWLLNINYNESTSMHCHPNKNTGLIVLDGEIELSFLTNKINLKSLNKINIFKSRFHSSKATSKNGACLLEIETPEDKDDLVRLYDNYGRENKGYEGKDSYLTKPNSAIYFGDAKEDADDIYSHGCIMKHKLINNFYDVKYIKDNDFVVFTSGGLDAGQNKKIVRPADVIDGKSLKLLSSKFNYQKFTSALIISKNR